MNYELAKQLKEAGFPLRYGVAAEYMREKEMNPELLRKYETALDSLKELYSKDTKEYARIPTLSELIDACGKKICAIEFEEDAMLAYFISDDGVEYKQGRGKTPEEAVARLWLALHS